ncbi:hypothetical protein AAII07_01080 [Microvirga sp. 0TCS3.31]
MQESDRPRFGIDTIAVRGPASAVHERVNGQRLRRAIDPATGEFTEHLTSERVRLDGGQNLEVQLWREPSGVVAMEFSVPKSVREDNRQPAGVQEAVLAVRMAHRAAAEAVNWRCEPEQLVISRIDLARDFTGISDPWNLIDRLAHVTPNRMSSHTYLSSDCRGVETLVRETDRHLSRLYDRASCYLATARAERGLLSGKARALAAAETGVVRYELQLRRKEAAKNGLEHVQDLEAAPLFGIAKHYFEDRCRFSAPVGVTGQSLRRAVAATDAKTTSALGQLMLDAFGVEGDCNPRTIAQYRDCYRALGLSPADLLHPQASPMQLDFDAGALVSATDASVAA